MPKKSTHPGRGAAEGAPVPVLGSAEKVLQHLEHRIWAQPLLAHLEVLMEGGALHRAQASVKESWCRMARHHHPADIPAGSQDLITISAKASIGCWT